VSVINIIFRKSFNFVLNYFKLYAELIVLIYKNYAYTLVCLFVFFASVIVIKFL